MSETSEVRTFRRWLVELWQSWQNPHLRWPSTPELHMFVDDVHSYIMPYRRQRLEVHCEGPAVDVASALRSLSHLSSRSSTHDDATEIVCEAIRGVVQNMLWRGYAVFQIEEEQTDDDHWLAPGDEASLGLAYRPVRALHYRSQMWLPGLFLIGVVGRDRRRWDRERPRVRLFRARQIWRVSMPRRLGGRVGFRWATAKLGRFSGVFPKWTATALAKEQNQLRFDLARYSRWRKVHEALAARRWSWNGRDTSLDHQTEFFMFYRTLGFHHALAILREHIVIELNHLVRRRLGLNVRIRLAGLPSPEEILAIRGRMERGEITLGAAFDQAIGP